MDGLFDDCEYEDINYEQDIKYEQDIPPVVQFADEHNPMVKVKFRDYEGNI
jgi:hypothetical protein